MSALALERLVRQASKLERKGMGKGHLTLRHHYDRYIHFGRNPPLRARDSTPEELTYLILVIEGGRLND
jgi:hypothetical protein